MLITKKLFIGAIELSWTSSSCCRKWTWYWSAEGPRHLPGWHEFNNAVGYVHQWLNNSVHIICHGVCCAMLLPVMNGKRVPEAFRNVASLGLHVEGNLQTKNVTIMRLLRLRSFIAVGIPGEADWTWYWRKDWLWYLQDADWCLHQETIMPNLRRNIAFYKELFSKRLTTIGIIHPNYWHFRKIPVKAFFKCAIISEKWWRFHCGTHFHDFLIVCVLLLR